MAARIVVGTAAVGSVAAAGLGYADLEQIPIILVHSLQL